MRRRIQPSFRPRRRDRWRSAEWHFGQFMAASGLQSVRQPGRRLRFGASDGRRNSTVGDETRCAAFHRVAKTARWRCPCRQDRVHDARAFLRPQAREGSAMRRDGPGWRAAGVATAMTVLAAGGGRGRRLTLPSMVGEPQPVRRRSAARTVGDCIPPAPEHRCYTRCDANPSRARCRGAWSDG